MALNRDLDENGNKDLFDVRRLSYTKRGGTKVKSDPSIKYYLVDEMKAILFNLGQSFDTSKKKSNLVDMIADMKSIDKTTIDGYDQRASHQRETQQRETEQREPIFNPRTYERYTSDYADSEEDIQRIADLLLEQTNYNSNIDQQYGFIRMIPVCTTFHETKTKKREKKKDNDSSVNKVKTLIVDPNIISVNCTICMDKMNYKLNGTKLIDNDDDGIDVRKCGHIFHQKCNKKWNNTAGRDAKCPLCRK